MRPSPAAFGNSKNKSNELLWRRLTLTWELTKLTLYCRGIQLKIRYSVNMARPNTYNIQNRYVDLVKWSANNWTCYWWSAEKMFRTSAPQLSTFYDSTHSTHSLVLVGVSRSVEVSHRCSGWQVVYIFCVFLFTNYTSYSYSIGIGRVPKYWLYGTVPV